MRAINHPDPNGNKSLTLVKEGVSYQIHLICADAIPYTCPIVSLALNNLRTHPCLELVPEVTIVANWSPGSWISF